MLNVPGYMPARGAPPHSTTIAIPSSSKAIDQQSPCSRAVSELKNVFNLAHRSYNTLGPVTRGACGTWMVDDSNPDHRSERRMAQAAAGLDPAHASPTGRASQHVARLIEEAYGTDIAAHMCHKHPALRNGAPLTPALLAQMRSDLVPAKLRAAGMFTQQVGEATRMAIMKDLAAGKGVADSCLAVDLNRALYRVDGREISRPGDDPEQAMARFIDAIPDADARRVIAQVAHQGTLADADAAASRSDDIFPGGFQRIQPHRSWQGDEPLRYEIEHRGDGGYTVSASVRQDAIGVCDPHIGDMEEATRLGVGSHYRVAVRVDIPASVIASQRYDDVSVEASYDIDFHPPSPVARPLQELIANTRSGRTCMSTYLALTDKLFDAVSHELERGIQDGRVPQPATAEASTAAWRTLIADATKELAWQTQREAKPVLETLAFDLNEQVRRFTSRLPDAMTLIDQADHYEVDIDTCDATALTRATAPFTLMQQAVLPGMAQAAFGDAADIIINEFEITPLRDPDPLDTETSSLLRERYRGLGMSIDAPMAAVRHRTDPVVAQDLPRQLDDGRRVITIDAQDTVVAYDGATQTWRVPGVNGFPTGDHMLYDEAKSAWVRRAPGLFGGAQSDIATRLLNSDLAGTIEAMADLSRLASFAVDNETSAAAILLQPGVLDALAAHIELAFPRSGAQHPNAGLPFEVAAQLLHRAVSGDSSLGAAIVDALLPADRPRASPMARLLEHHSLHFMHDATTAGTNLMRELAKSPVCSHALRARLAEADADGVAVYHYLKSNRGIGNDDFREVTRARLAERGLVPASKSKRALSPELLESVKRRTAIPGEETLRAAARTVLTRNEHNARELEQLGRAARHGHGVMQRRDQAERQEKELRHVQSQHYARLSARLEREAFRKSETAKTQHAETTRMKQVAEANDRLMERTQQRDRADARMRASLACMTQTHAMASAQRRQAATANRLGAMPQAAIAGSAPTRAAIGGGPRAAIGQSDGALMAHGAARDSHHGTMASSITFPHGTSIDTRTWRASVPVIAHGQAARFSIPLNERQPIIVAATPASRNALDTSSRAISNNRLPQLVDIQNSRRGMGITLAQDGNVSRMAIPHQPGLPIRLDFGQGSITFTAPERALPPARR